ncbi:MAG: hypothetical protein QG671_2364 [Actinomycetota bacterium]|jgi:hypothetical protein|nr:hypothetical protein [Actinomycetota bacterium]MDQ5975872.1 hypothetical protein [Actinomycetota bacterium]
MVLGIVGLCLTFFYGIGLIPAIVALALSPSAGREIDASAGTLTGRSQITAGIVCAWVAVGLIAFIAVILLIIAIAAVAQG